MDLNNNLSAGNPFSSDSPVYNPFAAAPSSSPSSPKNIPLPQDNSSLKGKPVYQKGKQEIDTSNPKFVKVKQDVKVNINGKNQECTITITIPKQKYDELAANNQKDKLINETIEKMVMLSQVYHLGKTTKSITLKGNNELLVKKNGESKEGAGKNIDEALKEKYEALRKKMSKAPEEKKQSLIARLNIARNLQAFFPSSKKSDGKSLGKHKFKPADKPEDKDEKNPFKANLDLLGHQRKGSAEKKESSSNNWWESEEEIKEAEKLMKEFNKKGEFLPKNDKEKEVEKLKQKEVEKNQ